MPAMCDNSLQWARHGIRHTLRIALRQQVSVVISGDGWFYDFGDSNRAFKRDCTVYTGY